MGRRKDRIAKEDYNSSDSGGSGDDEGDNEEQYGEFESFTQPSRRKKRRHGQRRSKEDAMLGVFAEDTSDDDRDLMRKNIRYKEVNFVEKEDEEEQNVQDDYEEEEVPRIGLGGMRTGSLGFRSAQQESTPQADTEETEEEDYRPGMGLGAKTLGGGSRSRRGFGLGFQLAQQPTYTDEEESYRPAIGFNPSLDQPLSTTFAQHTTTQSDTMHTTLPSAPKPSLLSSRKGTSAPSSRKYGLGASMLEKMGYKEGQGLGSEGQGMLNPIETKLRPERMGLGGVKEMTAQAKEEARRRGQIVSDDEDDKRRRRKKAMGGGSGTSTPRSRPKKVVYQTAEEMAGGMAVPATIQKLVDLQGREVDLNSVVGGKMEDELRIAQLARRDLKRFGDEWKALGEQKKYVDLERGRMKQELAVEEERIRKAEEVISEMEKMANSAAGQGMDGLDNISNDILSLQLKVANEDIIAFGLDEIVVGVIQPMVKQTVSEWDPLVDATSNGLTATLKSWNIILRIRSKHQQDEEIEAESGLLHHQSKLCSPQNPNLISRSSPYESLLYHTILPKIRSVINNAWTPYDPQPVVNLLETWFPLLPGFIHNLLLEQVIIPKLRRAIDHWNPRRTRETVHLWIFPWLPYLGAHMDDLVKTVQHKFKIVLETWDIQKGVVVGLEEWRELFGKGVLEDLLLKHILPKLALELRENLTIDPSDQKLDVLLETVMPWRNNFRASTWGKLLESEFFSKWLSMLHLWLTSEQVNLEEVGQWYEWWKHQVFPVEVLEMEGVRRGFKAGLDLMSKAADYTDQGISLSKLPAPMTGPQRPVSRPVRLQKKEVARAAVREIHETTFKDVLEDLCAENSLLLVPLRTADEATGKALFRITASADGKGGVVGYIGDGDVLWVQTKRQGPYEPIGLDKIVSLAERR